MPARPTSKRVRKARDKGYLKRQRLQRNLPMSYPRPSNLLVKSQYCDFECSLLVPIEAGAPPQANPLQTTTKVFSRFDNEGIIGPNFGFNSAPLWSKIRNVFEEYAIKGFRLEYLPTNTVG